MSATDTTPDLHVAPATPIFRRINPLLDAGGIATLSLLAVGFVGPWLIWVYANPVRATAATSHIELRMLVWSALLALLLPLIQINLHIRQFGGSAIRGNRADFPTTDGPGARIARAHRNMLESLVPFAIAVMAAQSLGVSNRWTIGASVLFLAARLVHAVTYMIGLTIVRSASFYAAHVATVVVICQLLKEGLLF